MSNGAARNTCGASSFNGSSFEAWSILRNLVFILRLLLLNEAQVLRFSKVLLGGCLLHLDLLGVMQLAQNAQSLVVVALVGHVSGQLDLLLHLLGVVHDENCDDSLRLHGLAVRSVRSRIDDNLSLLDRGDHGLLHRHHVSWLLGACHVHLRYSSWVSLTIDKHLLLVKLALSLVVISTRAGFAINDSWLTERTSHLTWHSNLWDQTLVHLG